MMNNVRNDEIAHWKNMELNRAHQLDVPEESTRNQYSAINYYVTGPSDKIINKEYVL